MSNPGQEPQAQPAGYGGCLRCGTLLQPVGIESFRVGGSSGGWKMLFGELAELGEGMIDFEIFACPACRKVELRVPVR
jgi:hypothetical protein